MESISNDPSPMQTSSILTDVVNNFLNGDVYICVRDEDGTEFTQIHPVRIEEVYVHIWEDEVPAFEVCQCGNTYYCKFKINSRLTHPMNLEVFPSLFHYDWNLALMTFHLMPYNIQVLSPDVYEGMQLMRSLKEFIYSAFPEIPKTSFHNYEGLKTGETVGIKRKRESRLASNE